MLMLFLFAKTTQYMSACKNKHTLDYYDSKFKCSVITTTTTTKNTKRKKLRFFL